MATNQAPDAPYLTGPVACRLVVAARSDLAGIVRDITAEAARRIMMSPMLSDVVDVGFADLGVRPQPGEPDQAAERIAGELTALTTSAGRYYFALLVVDHSATAIEAAFAGWQTAPAAATLPVHLRGLAAEDDREPRPTEAKEGEEAAGRRGSRPEIRLSLPGGWTASGLIGEIRAFAQDLFRDLAATADPGLTHDELAALRASLEPVLIPAPARAVPSGQHVTGNQPMTTSQPASASPPADATGPASTIQQASGGAPGPSSPVPPGSRPPAGSPALARLLRWRRRAPDRRPVPDVHSAPDLSPAQQALSGHEPTSTGPVADNGNSASRVCGLAYLLLAPGDGGEGTAAWRRGRSLLQTVDHKLVDAPGPYQVRTWQGGEEPMPGPLRPAGSGSRRSFRRSPAPAEYGRLLTAMRAALARDLRILVHTGTTIPTPTVVFFAAGVPLADPDTARAYQALAREATPVWVVPADLLDLMSPVFSAGSSRIIIDHPEAADEVADLLASGAVPPTAITGHRRVTGAAERQRLHTLRPERQWGNDHLLAAMVPTGSARSE